MDSIDLSASELAKLGRSIVKIGEGLHHDFSSRILEYVDRFTFRF